MIITVWFVLISFPLIMYLTTGKRVLIYPLLMPLIDENTEMGYSTITCLHLVWMTMLSIGLIGSDGLMAMFVAHIRPMVELFELDVAKLNSVLVLWPELKDSRPVEFWLRNLAKIHQEITEYEYIYSQHFLL